MADHSSGCSGIIRFVHCRSSGPLDLDCSGREIGTVASGTDVSASATGEERSTASGADDAVLAAGIK